MKTLERTKELQALTRNLITQYLQVDLDGDEYIFKEAWEECQDEEDTKIVNTEIKRIIGIINLPTH